MILDTRNLEPDNNSSTSSSRKSNISYTTCDYGLVLFQRLLICMSVILGYDLVTAPQEIPHMFIVYSMARIIRNFFYITKGMRKWLAIHYNDGIIPGPPLKYGRSFRVARSTPRDSHMSSGFGHSLKHSPIERRYSEPPHNFDLATAIKEQRNKSEGVEPKYRYPNSTNSSDCFGNSSATVSLRFILNSFAQSFIGYIDDPDEEMSKEIASQHNQVGIQAPKKARSRIEKSIVLDNSENLRRTREVVQSVLENDAKQLSYNSSEDSEVQPLPILNFDATIDSFQIS